jgi:hypothetical protein
LRFEKLGETAGELSDRVTGGTIGLLENEGAPTRDGGSNVRIARNPTRIADVNLQKSAGCLSNSLTNEGRLFGRVGLIDEDFE